MIRPRRVPAALGALLTAILVGAAPACSPPPLDSCADDLTGIWRGEGRAPSGEPWRFQIVEARGEREPATTTVTIYPMFDDSAPPRGLAAPDVHHAPGFYAITRRGKTLVGTRTYHASRAGQVCTMTHQAAIRSCRDQRIQLAWIATASIDWATCNALTASRWTTVELTRE